MSRRPAKTWSMGAGGSAITQRQPTRGGGTSMSATGRQLGLSYGIAAAGVIVAGLAHWWLVPLIGDSPPVRLMLVVVVTCSAWLGGLGPGLFATAMGLIAIVVAHDI